MDTLSICEYDKLHIRTQRDLSRNIISVDDARYLQSVVLDENPVFKYGNKCLIAQQWVGVIELPDFTLEILPKLFGFVDTNQLREVLVRMLLVVNQSSSIRELQGSVSMRKNSLAEMLIETFLVELRLYVESGLQHAYKKITRNLPSVKGQIVFSQQLRKNALAPTRFYCKFSSYIEDYDLNRFFKTCLSCMNRVSRDSHNKKVIEELLPTFQDITDVSQEEALLYNIYFDSLNARAETAYKYGLLFLRGIMATMNAGTTPIYTMLFDMNTLYEVFVYRVASIVYGNKVTYQKRGSYMISRDSDGKKFVSLRPDLTLKISDSEQWIIDTKWKIPYKFARESDVYQMNAYSTSIRNVSKVILLYPRVSSSDRLVGYYTLLSSKGANRPLEIRTIDLMECLDWKKFLDSFRKKFTLTP